MTGKKLKIDKLKAAQIVRDEAINTGAGENYQEWLDKINQFSRLCDEGISKTHIAFLGSAILAKAYSRHVDLNAIKPKHAKDNPNAFSARTLCHGVLVPLSAEFGFSIGVSGREPLNNQPYFRMTRLDDGTPVHTGGQQAFDYMLTLISQLQNLLTEVEARSALCAFIEVRRGYQPRYLEYAGDRTISPAGLTLAIEVFVKENSERGKRAQAVVAGLVDVFAGRNRVESGRINDPSRKYPGDVCVASADDSGNWEKSIEVRDKPVSESDVRIFGRRCVDMGVREASLVMVSDKQKVLDQAALADWANSFGIGLTLFFGWKAFVDQVLYWSELPKPIGANSAIQLIHDRLIEVEVVPESVVLWEELTNNPSST